MHAGGSSFGCIPVFDVVLIVKWEPDSVFGECWKRESVSFSVGGGRAGARLLMYCTEAEPGAGTGNVEARRGVVGGVEGIWSRPTHRSRPYPSHSS